MVVLGSREQMCINSDIKQLRGRAQNQACRALCKSRSCHHQNRVAGTRHDLTIALLYMYVSNLRNCILNPVNINNAFLEDLRQPWFWFYWVKIYDSCKRGILHTEG